MQQRSQVPAPSRGTAHAAGPHSTRRRPALLRVLSLPFGGLGGLGGRGRRRSAAEWVTQQELDAELGYGRD